MWGSPFNKKVLCAIELCSGDLIPPLGKSLSIQFMDFGRKITQNRFEPDVFIDLKKF
jgi:hypothetical protein